MKIVFFLIRRLALSYNLDPEAFYHQIYNTLFWKFRLRDHSNNTWHYVGHFCYTLPTCHACTVWRDIWFFQKLVFFLRKSWQIYKNMFQNFGKCRVTLWLTPSLPMWHLVTFPYHLSHFPRECHVLFEWPLISNGQRGVHELCHEVKANIGPTFIFTYIKVIRQPLSLNWFVLVL